MNDTIENYVETVCNCIKWKDYRFAVSKELKNHIFDSMDNFTGQGMPEEEALDLTLQNMGDPHTLGEQFDEVYKPECDKMLIFTVIFPIILFSLCEYLAVLEATGDFFYLIKVLFRILMGSLGAFLLFQYNWAGDGRLNRFVLKAYIGIGIACITFHFFIFPDKANIVKGMILLLPPLCCCCIDRVKDRRVAGLVIVMAVFMVPIFIAYYVQSFASIAVLAISGWMICILTVRSSWLNIDKKGFWYVFVSFPYLIIFLYSVAAKKDNILLNRRGFFAWEIIRGSVICGKGRADIADYKSILDYPATLITAKYGYIMLAAYVIFFGFILCEIVKVYNRQQSFIARLLIISVWLGFVTEFVFSLILNLGVPLVKGIPVPFLDFTFGIVIKLMQLGLVMKLDCFGNYIFSDYSDNRLFDVEGGKVIIYYR